MVLRKGLPRQILLWLARGIDTYNTYFNYHALRYSAYFGVRKKQVLYKTVSNLLSVGDIKKIIKNGKVYLQLTSQGSSRLKQNIPLYKFSQVSWDGFWRMVIFDIKEKNRWIRDNLRYKLQQLSFGQWQKSVYISPFAVESEIREYLRHNKFDKHCFCLVAKKLGDQSDAKIAAGVFKLGKLTERYIDWIQKAKRLMMGTSDDQHVNTRAQILVSQYYELVLSDPGLPKELLPRSWIGGEAGAIFRQLADYLDKLDQ